MNLLPHSLNRLNRRRFYNSFTYNLGSRPRYVRYKMVFKCFNQIIQDIDLFNLIDTQIP